MAFFSIGNFSPEGCLESLQIPPNSPTFLQILDDNTNLADLNQAIRKELAAIFNKMPNDSDHYLIKNIFRPLITPALVPYFIKGYFTHRDDISKKSLLHSKFNIYTFFPPKTMSDEYQKELDTMGAIDRENFFEYKDAKEKPTPSTELNIDGRQNFHICIHNLLSCPIWWLHQQRVHRKHCLPI